MQNIFELRKSLPDLAKHILQYCVNAANLREREGEGERSVLSTDNIDSPNTSNQFPTYKMSFPWNPVNMEFSISPVGSRLGEKKTTLLREKSVHATLS